MNGASAGIDRCGLEQAIDSYLQRLFPICRSITGEGNRETLRILQELIPIAICEVPSGTPAYDWTVPDEWNIFGAWIAVGDGRRIVDFHRNNLHVVSYSEPVHAILGWEELRPHLHIHPALPSAIPYRTSYYKRNWGFCLTYEQYRELERIGGSFEVVIDSRLAPGSLTYGELLLPGDSPREVLCSSYICHPSMANDSLSGILAAAFLARDLLLRPMRRYSWRFIFVPETIGAIAYCAGNATAMREIDMGLVVTTCGGPGKFGYKQSFDSSHPINLMIEDVFAARGIDFMRYPFDIHGSDERQYSSPGFRINVATISRDKYYEYPQYHSSLDDLAFVTGRQIAETFALYVDLVDRIESRVIYRATRPNCEVMLSRHGLYPETGGAQRPEFEQRSELDLTLWLLFLCDGRLDLATIAKRLGVSIATLRAVAEKLVSRNMLDRVG